MGLASLGLEPMIIQVKARSFLGVSHDFESHRILAKQRRRFQLSWFVGTLIGPACGPRRRTAAEASNAFCGCRRLTERFNL